MDELLQYFPILTEKQIEQFQKLEPLYRDWNQKINVISRKNMNELYIHHVLHSLAVAKFLAFKPGSQILDVGTGGGFPGIPLAILYPDSDFDLVDSIGKKIKVVNEVANELGLQNVKSHHERAEKMPSLYDFIVTRAVAPMDTIYNWSKDKFKKVSKNSKPNGIIALKGGDLSVELKKFENRVEVQNISDYFDHEFFDTKKIVYLPVEL